MNNISLVMKPGTPESFKFQQVKVFGFLLHLQCYYSVMNAFQLVFSTKAFKVCIEAHTIW